ncbi:MAG: PrsW family glutamic-type intramembrane protease, partial [bacterium]|nr:PrsW family glutamic-type intramembrane protease [bacterium]
EFLKYGAVRLSVLKKRVVDEPIDIPLYMIVGALGFAALENTLILAGFSSYSPFLSLASLSVFRFVGAVFLHALVAGFLGVSIVMKRPLWGFMGATFLHGLFNLYIIQGTEIWRYAVPMAIILFLASYVPFAISKLQPIKS